MKKYCQSVLVLGALLCSSLSYAGVSSDGIWSDLEQRSTGVKEYPYRSLSAKGSQLQYILSGAPVEGSGDGLEISLPLPDGSFVRVLAFESPIMSPALAAKLSHIKTYKVYGLDDASLSGRLDINNGVLRGILMGDHGTTYIEPESSYDGLARGSDIYRSFNKTDYPRKHPMRCNVDGHNHFITADDSRNLQRAFPLQESMKSAGDKKRTYRLAMAATSEYTAAVSTGTPTVAQGQAAIVTAINRINQIYEKEVSVSFTLVDNSNIVFDGTVDDGYTNSSGSTMLAENQTKLDAVIGSANYDIGHVFSTGGGGVATLASVCNSGRVSVPPNPATDFDPAKARGVTGLPNPVGDPFVVDFVAHEIGHQFGATHTFNAGGSASGNCTDGARENHTSTAGGSVLSDSAYEPGSGSTIMAYAGICSQQNIQTNSDPYFHARSLEQIREFVNGEVLFANTLGNICGTETNTGNTPPTANAGLDYTIPANTPFALTGSGSDIDAADVATLNYTWEQYDLGTKTTTLAEMHTDADTRPIVRSRMGTSSPTRYIPALDAILEGNLTKYLGERLPTTDRDMKFRLTVRSGAQGFNQDDMTVTVDKDAGPFEVTGPVPLAPGNFLTGGHSPTVSWNVANTNNPPVSCSNVTTSFSTDGGLTFPYVLEASTPNDGSHISLTSGLPNIATTQGRFKVACVDNIFFNVTTQDFEVRTENIMTVAATSAHKVEGTGANSMFTFTVSRTGDRVQGASGVTYTVSGSGTNPADASDFGGSFPTGWIQFLDGDITKVISIPVIGDSDVEPDEEFTVSLSNPAAGTVGATGTSTATGTILNDESTLSIAALDASKAEGDSSSTAFTFTVTRSGVTTTAVSASYAVTGAAVDGADFGGSLPTGMVSFAGGVTSQTITINVSGDTALEGDEAFTVTLSSPVSTTIDTASANGLIQNDDESVSIAATSASKDEGDTGTTAFTFTVTRTGDTSGASNVNYAVTSTAANAADFGGSLPSGTVNFADGETSELITINVSGDTDVEADEAFTVTLSSPVSTTIGTATANGSIQNDDSAVSIAADSAAKAEGDTGTTAYTFTVNRTGSTSGTASVNYAVTSATANAADFGGSLPTGTVSFADGDSSETVTINVSGDNTVEADEAFTVTLSAPTNTVIGTASANGAIQNDDGTVSITADSAVKAEGDAGTTAYTFTVTRTDDTSGIATVNYAVTSAAADTADFGGSLPTGTVTFADGDTSETVTINVSGDNAIEADEVFTVTLSTPSNAVIGTSSANGTIQNDDGGVAIAATSAVKVEGDAGTTAYTFTVTRSGNTSGIATINYAVTSAVANAADFGGSLPTGMVTFADGDTSETITINVSGDNSVETDEEFTVTLNTPVNAVIGTASANGTIQNDDSSVSIAVDSAVKAEGDSSTTAYTFTVTRTGSTLGAASANYAVTSAAADGVDFGGSLPTGTVTFADGDASETITVNVSGDNTVEADEAFTVTLNAPVNTVLGTASANGTIQNDDATVSIAVDSAVKPEGDTGTTAYTFTVTRADSTSGVTTVNYAVTSAAADAADFGGSLPTGTVTFADGDASETITVNVSGDNTVEADEAFTVTLNAPVNTVIGTASANGTIQNDDATVSIAVDSAVKPEGDTGTTAYTFTVTRADSTSGVTTVNYAVTSAAANAADFGGSLPTGTVTFADGDASETITVNVSGDNTVEADEAFTVTLNTPVNTVIGTASVNGTIQNDDATVSIAADSAVKAEGNSGTTAYTFTVTRTDNTSGITTVNYAVTSAAADAADFGGSLPTGTVTFADGDASETITVNVSSDNSVEADEAFTVTLSSPNNAVIGTASANGTIQNDDVSLAIVATSADKVEGNAGTTAFTFTVTRTGHTTSTVSAAYVVSTSEVSASDFSGSALSGSVNFASGVITQVITLNVVGDTDVEADEAFTVTLLGHAGVGVGIDSGVDVANGVIRNDDASLAIVADSTVKAEGDTGTIPFTFTVTRTGNTTGTASVNYAVTSAAADGADFGGSLPTGIVTFAAGDASETITVNVSGDNAVEADEAFTVTLSTPTNAVIGTASANGTIQNDDGTVSIAADSAVKAEGDTGTTAYTFTVTRTDDTSGVATVNYAVTSAAADAADFGGLLPTGTVTFADGDSSETLTINVSGDNAVEADEAFTVTLNTPVNAVIGTASANGTIQNDDATVSIAADSAVKVEGNSGTTAYTFTVTRADNTSGVTTVNYVVTSATADAADFGGSLPTGTVTFADGDASETITINVSGDSSVETDEAFTVTLSSPNNAVIGTASANGTIQNDDASVAISVTNADMLEGDAGGTSFTFEVTRTGDTSSAATVDYAVSGSTANAADASDFVGGVFPSATINFLATEVTKTITINVAGDTDVESVEGFVVTLSSPSAGTVIATATAEGLIKNDDGPVEYSITALNAVQNEGNTGTTAFTFNVIRSGTPLAAGTETIDYAVTGSGVNAATSSDFGGTFASGSLTFGVGVHTQVVTINVSGDLDLEANEGFTVTLSDAPSGTAIATATAEGVIQNDDAALSIAEPTVIKPVNDNGLYTFVFTVTRTAGAIGASSVQYAVTGSGSNPVTAMDFGGSLPTGTINFAPGQSTAEVRISISASAATSTVKTFTVTLSNPVNASLATTSATGSIDATAPTVPVVAASGGGGGGSLAWWSLLILFGLSVARRRHG